MSDLRGLEANSIRAFVQSAADRSLLGGKVLDYGCGQAPYRDIVEAAGGEWIGYDRTDLPANVSGENLGGDALAIDDYDAVLTTQTIQYWIEPEVELEYLRSFLHDDGALVITGPTNWPWVEPEDRRRYTPTEITRLLHRAGYHDIEVVERGAFQCGGISWLLGWGAIARPRLSRTSENPAEEQMELGS